VVDVVAPQSAMAMLFGKGGATLKQLEEETQCRVQVDDRYDADGSDKATRSVRIWSTASTATQRETSREICSRVVRSLCQGSSQTEWDLKDALTLAQVEMISEAEAKEDAERRLDEDRVVQQVRLATGDSFNETTVRDALSKDNWDQDLAADRLFRERAATERPALDAKRLLEACRAAKAPQAGPSIEDEFGETSKPTCAASSCHDDAISVVSTAASQGESPVSRDVQMIRDVFARIRR